MQAIYKKYALLDIRNLYTFELGKFAYKNFNAGVLPEHKRTYEIYDNTRTRSTRCLKLPVLKTELRKRGVDMSVGSFWNGLSEELRESRTIGLFKRQLRRTLLYGE